MQFGAKSGEQNFPTKPQGPPYAHIFPYQTKFGFSDETTGFSNRRMDILFTYRLYSSKIETTRKVYEKINNQRGQKWGEKKLRHCIIREIREKWNGIIWDTMLISFCEYTLLITQ